MLPILLSAVIAASAIALAVDGAVLEAQGGRTIGQRAEAAERLYRLTRGDAPRHLTDAELDKIAALLGSRDDVVRLWAASTIGNLGPRGKRFTPQLLIALSQVNCLPVDLSSEPAIRAALERVRSPPPPRTCQRRQHPLPAQ